MTKNYMKQFLSKYSMKVKLVTFVSIISAIAFGVWQASGVVANVDSNTKGIEKNIKDVVKIQEQIEAIPIIQVDIRYIREDIAEIKNLLDRLINKSG